MPTVNGKVKSIGVSGIDRDSAELIFVVKNVSLRLGFKRHETQAFVGISNLVTTAYFWKLEVGVEYEVSSVSTNEVSAVYLPPRQSSSKSTNEK